MSWSRKHLSATLLSVLIASCGQSSTQAPSTRDATPDIEPEDDLKKEVDLPAPYEDPTPPDLWPQIQSKCAKAHTLPAQEPWQAPVKFEGKLEAQLKWAQKRVCIFPDQTGDAYDMSEANSIALGMHQGKPAVVALITHPSVFPQPGYGVKQLGWFQAEDGAPLDCINSPDPQGIAIKGLLLTPFHEHHPVSVMHTFQDTYSRGLSGYKTSLTWWSPAWESTTTKLALPKGSYELKDAKLLPDGQLIIVYANSLISVDAQDGSLNWVVESSDIVPTLPDGKKSYSLLKIKDLQWDASKRAFAITTLIPAQGEYIEHKVAVDHCGQVIKPWPTSFAYEVALGQGQAFITSSRSAAWTIQTRDSSGNVLKELSLCQELFALDKDRIACLKPQVASLGKVQLSILSWPDQVTTFKFDKSHTPGNNAFYSLKGAALANGLFATTVQYDNERFTPEAGLMFIDTHTGEVVNFVRLKDPATNSSASPLHTPLVDEEGTVYVMDWSHIIAIKTNSKGLAKTGFPRGWTLGNNSNAGYFPSP